MLKRRLQRLIPVYTCQNVKLLEISCHGSYITVPCLLVHSSALAECAIGLYAAFPSSYLALCRGYKKEQKNFYLELVEILYLGMYRSISICKFLSEKFQFIYIVS